MKRAIVLAAGVGRRLGAAGLGRPKCLQEIDGRCLLDLQLDVLQGAGIHEICVVVGHAADQVRAAVAERPGVITLDNPEFAETNSLYSLWLAREFAGESFLCLNGDVLAHPDVFHRVMAVEGSALAFDSGSGEDPEHMKVAVDGGFLRAISKVMPLDEVGGENVGLLQFDADGSARLFEEIAAIVDAGLVRNWVAASMDRIAGEVPIRCMDIAGLAWTEIDFPEDLQDARKRVWPLLRPHYGLPARPQPQPVVKVAQQAV